jgi:two-component system, response regulator YesN
MRVSRYINKFQDNVKSSVFCRTFLILVAVIVISVASAAFTSLRYSSKHIINQVSKSNAEMLSDKSRIIDEKLREIDKKVYQSISDNNIWSIMRAEVFTENHSFMIRDIIKAFNSIMLSNDMISSMCFYDTNHLFVITNTTKYTKADFYDQELFAYENIYGNIYVSPPRYVNNKKVITYIRKFNAYTKDNTGYFVINLDYSRLFGNWAEKDKGNKLPIAVLGNNSTVFYSSDKLTEDLAGSAAQRLLRDDKPYGIYFVEGQRYFISKTNSNVLDWTYITIQEYTAIVKPVEFMIRVILMSMVVVLLFLLVLGYRFSYYLYNPLLKLLKSINNYRPSSALITQNEYEAIDRIIKELDSSNRELKSKYNAAFPYLQQHSIQDFLANQGNQAEGLSTALELMDVDFNYSNYCAIIVDFESRRIQTGDKSIMEEAFKPFLDRLVLVVTKVSNFRMLIVINTTLDGESIYLMVQDMKGCINQAGIEVTISLSHLFYGLHNLTAAYGQALQQLDSRFFLGKNKIIYNITMPKNYDYLAYDRVSQEKLVNHIKSCNCEKALETLDIFLKQNLDRCICSVDYTRYLFLQLCMDILAVVKGCGVREMESFMTEFQVFKQIQSSDTMDSLKEFVTMLISKSIIFIEESKKRHYSEIVEKILAYLQQNYASPLTLEDISGAVFISPKYLCSLFKDEMGITIFDYITKLRMDKARELLLQSEMQIQSIGSTVGYSNVQSFIRFFKRYYLLTPEQYRKAHRIR